MTSHAESGDRPRTAINGVFVTATGTGVGKTSVSRALVCALVRRGLRVAALKPIETGCAPFPADALHLARACGQPSLAHADAWYRAELPLAPYAVELSTGQAAPNLQAITEHSHQLARHFELTLVEGAGGLLVPLDRDRSMADLAAALELPLLLVADDRLGVLSHVLSAFELAVRRQLPIRAVVLNRIVADDSDRSQSLNARILAERLPVSILSFPTLRSDDDTELADAAERIGLATLFDPRERPSD